ncbi:MAG: hypothetical protein CM1200mP2_54860 [Planctomycetaceae bacterium]|nr:MAG: hypothetical protein CM1200mP2_54860 [Planctomycetaceae bacterium]
MPGGTIAETVTGLTESAGTFPRKHFAMAGYLCLWPLPAGAAVLVKWHPNARPAEPVKRELDPLGTICLVRHFGAGLARPNVDYQVKQNALVMTGQAWIQVPLDKRLAALDKNGTIELVFKPKHKVACRSLSRVRHTGSKDFASRTTSAAVSRRPNKCSTVING